MEIVRSKTNKTLAEMLSEIKTGPLERETPADHECHGGWLYDADRQAFRCPHCEANRKLLMLKKVYRDAGLPTTLFDATWDTVNLEHESWKAAHRYAQNLSEALEMRIGALFIGSVGRGKSQACALLAKTALEGGLSVVMTTVPRWVGEVLASYKSDEITENVMVAQLVRPDLLILDDVGAAETQNGALEERLLTRVIGERTDFGRITVMNSNLGPAEFKKSIGGRAWDRMEKSSLRIVFDGPHYRAAKDSARVVQFMARVKAA